MFKEFVLLVLAKMSTSNIYDYIITGAGSSGCVIANRLSANEKIRVLLIEAGPEDYSFLIQIPKGMGQTLKDQKLTWNYATECETGTGYKNEPWLRGKTLGGSSSVNGMLYVRGQPQDYDDWEHLGNHGWGWKAVAASFKAMEDYAGGESAYRGIKGPLHISRTTAEDPLSRAFIDSGKKMGLTFLDDLNQVDHEGVGYFQRTIKAGRRISSSVAFLKPILHRKNLTILTRAKVNKIIFDGTKAVGVACSHNERDEVFYCSREIIISAGAIQSPLLLQLSGIGDSGHLKDLGVPIVHHNPNVGMNLREHRVFPIQYRLNKPLSENFEYSGLRLAKNLLKYWLFKTGPLATPYCNVGAFIKSNPSAARSDAQLFVSPFSMIVDTIQGKEQLQFEKEHGIQFLGYALRPRSQGSIKASSSLPGAAPIIRPNYLHDDYDKTVTINAFKYIKKYVQQSPLKDLIAYESFPGKELNTDDEIIDYR